MESESQGVPSGDEGLNPNPPRPRSDGFPPNLAPQTVDVTQAADDEEEERVIRNAWPPVSGYLFEWLKTPEGQQLAATISAAVQSFQKQALERRYRQHMVEIIGRYALVLAVLGGAVYLQVLEKLTPVMIGLLSGALGYLLGRQKSE